MSWNDDLCHQAGEMLVSEWNTTTPFPFSMMHALVTVQVPCSVNETTSKNGNNSVCYDWPIGNFTNFLLGGENKIWVRKSKPNLLIILTYTTCRFLFSK